MRSLLHLPGRVRRRVSAHRSEALIMAAFMITVGLIAQATAASGWLPRVLGDGPAAGVTADVFLAFALCWVPLFIIDFRRCNRETALRAEVQAELEREAAAKRAQAEELEAIRAATEEVIEAGGPRIVYQPIVDMRHNAVVAYEALSRFDDSVSPDVWFKNAARVNLGAELELAAVGAAIVGFQPRSEGAYLSVNVSPTTLCDPRLFELVSATSPQRIVLELTEHLAVDDYCQYRAAVAHLRGLGVRLAVDDAGAGYASFRHIVDLHPDIIKIDGSLVQGAHLDSSRRSLIMAFVTFAADLGATLVAEGVELDAEADALRAWGVGFGQGWLFGKPGPLAVPDTAPARRLRTSLSA